MSHTIRDKQKLKARASKIQGQVVALKKMLDEPHECAAVLQHYHPPLRFIIATKRLGVPFFVKAEKYPYHLIWIMPA